MRESPALEILEMLLGRHADVSYVDSFVPRLQLEHETLQAVPLTDDALSSADCVVIVTDHSEVDYERVVRLAPLVVDTRNATADISGADHVWRLVRPVSNTEPVKQPALTPVG